MVKHLSLGLSELGVLDDHDPGIPIYINYKNIESELKGFFFFCFFFLLKSRSYILRMQIL